MMEGVTPIEHRTVLGLSKRPPARVDECRPRKFAAHGQSNVAGPERDSLSPGLPVSAPCTARSGAERQQGALASSSGSSSSSDAHMFCQGEPVETQAAGVVERRDVWGPGSHCEDAVPSGSAQQLEMHTPGVGEEHHRLRSSRRVTFAQGPLPSSPDGHPDRTSSCPRRLSTFACTAPHPPAETLTRANILAMEQELGTDFQQANSSSLVRLKRRVRTLCPAHDTCQEPVLARL
jgi:hypothetical protein